MSEIKLPLFTIGGGIKHHENLIKEFVNHKQFLDTSHKLFNSVYDSIFGLRWNGGRICNPKDFLTISDCILLIQKYNELRVGFNWSFTNLLLKEEDLKDDYCNLLLEASNSSSLNGVILTSELLRDYIKKTYSNLKVIYSVCNGLKTIDEYKKALDENDLVVLHPDFNHNLSFLEKLPDKDRIEVMVNDICSFGCPYRYQHYLELSKYTLQQSKNPIISFSEELDCSRQKACLAVQAGYSKDKRNCLSFEDISNLLDMGFVHFKIIGREHEWTDYWPNTLNKYLNGYFLRQLVKNAGLDHHI